MANWESTTIFSSFDAKSAAANHMANREGGREGVSTSAKSQYDVVGIKVDKIPFIQGEITAYINTLKDKINNLNPKAISSTAFKSKEEIVENAVESYITKVKTYCNNLLSQLEAFNDKLSDVLAAWDQGTQSISSKIDETNTSFSEGTVYQRQRQ